MEVRLPQAASDLIGALERAGFAAYAVGGCVRDSLMGRMPHDWDICTDARPEEMQACLGGQVKLLPTGIAHGTLTALVDHVPYEITTFRVDGGYADHRRPDAVRYVEDIRADLARRDFTINAMAYHPRRGLIDPFDGRGDIARGLVRCVGDPSLRFDEDALRILRALRFAASCGFEVEAGTAAAALALRGTLCYVARERVRAEIERLLVASEAARGLEGFGEVLLAAMPGIRPVACDPERWARAVARVMAAPRERALRWAALLWELEPEAASSLLRELRGDNATRLRVEALLAHRDLPLLPERVALLRALRVLGVAALRELLLLRTADARAQGRAEEAGELRAAASALEALVDTNPCYSLGGLAVRGEDLQALGLQGREVGHMLEALLDAVIEGRMDNMREALLAAAEATGHPRT